MREKIIPNEISKAIANFKAGEMVEGLKQAGEEVVEKFKSNELPPLL